MSDCLNFSECSVFRTRDFDLSQKRILVQTNPIWDRDTKILLKERYETYAVLIIAISLSKKKKSSKKKLQWDERKKTEGT